MGRARKPQERQVRPKATPNPKKRGTGGERITRKAQKFQKKVSKKVSRHADKKKNDIKKKAKIAKAKFGGKK